MNKNPSLRELRQFGWTLIIGFCLLGAVFFWRGKMNTAYGFWSIAPPLGIVVLLIPSAAKQLYKLWMGWAYIMGTVVTRVILTLLFFGVITPVAIFFRCIGRDLLRLKRDPNIESYWSEHCKIVGRSYYKRLF